MKDKFVSPRVIKEEARQKRIDTFDKFVDLALDGVITIDQAILGFKETVANDVPLHD